ncbi:hypothetical protein [Mucilaginibacter agri]|uniref:Organic solvent tolerance-like N-terminal domain-containing protein n=1 Tax=Mucilaginibacter agri TaxID=2695265 RepID=A0A965ZIT8_9SPHI|nr:hypothetical protein [Mucilaginibacter agri]NCD70903.1 hypothetical protein [Mucilaginibacter agri]
MKLSNHVFNVGLLICLLPLALAFTKNSKVNHAYKPSTDTIIPPRFETDTLKFLASDSTVVDKDQHTVRLYGKACITNSSTRVNADYIEYNTDEKIGTAKGNVILYDIGENVMAKSSEAVLSLK